MRRLAVSCCALLACLGCGRENLDLLETTTPNDPCLASTTEVECKSQATLGCSFQPNVEGCLSSEAGCMPGTCRSGDPFVRRVERSFLLGGAPFRFVGVSSWGLLLPGTCADPVEDREAWLRAAFDGLVASRSKVARMFAFQSSAGPSGEDFSFFDAAVREARRAGVRLIFMLEHSSGSCSKPEPPPQTPPQPRDAAWYANGFTQPDEGYARSYLTFAKDVATRYSHEPTVLGYVLMQNMGNADTDAVETFVKAAGGAVRQAAQNQLLSLDLSWASASADGGAAFRRLQSLPEVDYVDVDDYQFQPELAPLDETLLSVVGELEKPAVIGEGAFELKGDSPMHFAARAELARTRQQQWRDWGFEGALLWAYQPGWQQVSEEFDARAEDPLLQPGGVLADAPW